MFASIKEMTAHFIQLRCLVFMGVIIMGAALWNNEIICLVVQCRGYDEKILSFVEKEKPVNTVGTIRNGAINEA